MRTYLDQGFVVAGGTDSAVVPYPPLWVIYHFVSRDTISGGVLGAEQKISRAEALRVEVRHWIGRQIATDQLIRGPEQTLHQR